MWPIGRTAPSSHHLGSLGINMGPWNHFRSLRFSVKKITNSLTWHFSKKSGRGKNTSSVFSNPFSLWTPTCPSFTTCWLWDLRQVTSHLWVKIWWREEAREKGVGDQGNPRLGLGMTKIMCRVIDCTLSASVASFFPSWLRTASYGSLPFLTSLHPGERLSPPVLLA